ncbi:hypothetical protein [Micromonospora rubida]
MQQPAAGPLQLPADRQLPRRQVDGVLGDAEHLTLAQAEHQSATWSAVMVVLGAAVRWRLTMWGRSARARSASWWP